MGDDVKLCLRCKGRPRKAHCNAKWCGLCAEALKRRPAHRLTPSQQAKVRRLAGTMGRDDVAKAVGASLSAVRRFCRDQGISLNFFRDYTAEERRAVCEFYAQHGKRATIERFPGVKIRSIVERYLKDYAPPRQRRWTDDELIEAARMAGIISPESQALYFRRPNTNAVSIRSLWMKRFRQGGGRINGLPVHIAKRVCPVRWNGARFTFPFEPLELPFWSRRRAAKGADWSRRLCLWVDIEKHMRSDIDADLKAAIQAMAKFQRWLFGTTEVRRAVAALIRHREKAWQATSSEATQSLRQRQTNTSPSTREASSKRLRA